MLAGLCGGPCCDDVVKQFVSLDLDSLNSVRASTVRDACGVETRV